MVVAMIGGSLAGYALLAGGMAAVPVVVEGRNGADVHIVDGVVDVRRVAVLEPLQRADAAAGAAGEVNRCDG